MCTHTWVWIHLSLCTCGGSEDNSQELLLFFHNMGPGDDIRLGIKHLYLLNHVNRARNIFYLFSLFIDIII